MNSKAQTGAVLNIEGFLDNKISVNIDNYIAEEWEL